VSVGYTEVESQGFIVTALDHSGYLFVDPVDWEHTEEVGLDSIPKIDDLRSLNIFRSLASVATATAELRIEKKTRPLTKIEYDIHMRSLQKLSSGLSTLRKIGEDLSGTAIDLKRHPMLNQHYVNLALKLGARGALPHLRRPS
jgi:hypothetical protein